MGGRTMARNPPDIGKMKDALKASERPAFPFAAHLAAAALLIAILAFVFLPKAGGEAGTGEIQVFLQGPSSVPEGTPVEISAFSSCGQFAAFVDGVEEQSYAESAKVGLSLAPGAHVFEAKNANCSASVGFVVEKSECIGGESEACIESNCLGNRTCFAGKWGGCSLPEKVCSPGERIGCSYDGCHFGHAVCNACGSGFGNCTQDSGANKSSGCTGNACG